jgi:hypothetical protein
VVVVAGSRGLGADLGAALDRRLRPSAHELEPEPEGLVDDQPAPIAAAPIVRRRRAQDRLDLE